MYISGIVLDPPGMKSLVCFFFFKGSIKELPISPKSSYHVKVNKLFYRVLKSKHLRSKDTEVFVADMSSAGVVLPGLMKSKVKAAVFMENLNT